jgi:hypothetical protein
MIESIWSHPGKLHQVRETVRHGLRQALNRCELHCIIYRADDLLRLLNSPGQHTMFHEPTLSHAARSSLHRLRLANCLPPRDSI